MRMLCTFEDAISGFLLDRRISGLTAASIQTYRCHLAVFYRWCSDRQRLFSELTAGDVREYLAQRQSLSQSRLVEAYRRLQPFFRWAEAENYCENLFEKIRKPKEPQTQVSALTKDHVKAMLATCRGGGLLGLRDEALIRLLVDSGLRVSEALALTVQDIRFDDGAIAVHRGKGQKDRTVYIGPKTCKALLRYLCHRLKNPGGLVFLTRQASPLTRCSACHLISKIGRKAGIVGVRVSPHSLRHTFATWFLRSGGDVFSLQRQLGHASLTMTRKYLDLTAVDLASAHARHSPGNMV